MTDDTSLSVDGIINKTPWKLIAVILALTAFVYVLRGWTGIRMLTLPFYIHIEIIWGIIVGTIISAGIYWYRRYRNPERYENTKSLFSRLLSRPFDVTIQLSPYIVLTFVIVAVFLGLGTMFAQQSVVADTNPDELDGMYDPDIDDPRMLPMVTADTYANNNMQMQTHKLGQPADISTYNGHQHWAYSLEPEGFGNRLNEKQAGVMMVNMSTMTTDVEVYEQEMDNGKGDWAHNSHDWNLYTDEYTVKYGDTYPVVHDDELYMVTPYIDYELEFTFPTFYHKPVFGGVAIMHSDGTIERVGADEVQSHELLDNQRTYPYELAEYEVASQRYTNGIVNRFVFRDGVPEIAEITGEDNSQPFYVNTEDGMKYIFGAEPAGEGGGVYQMWYFNAQTGEKELYEPNETFMGPSSVGGYVTGNMPIVSWDDRITSEPIPVHVNGEPYWMIRATPESGSGVSFIAFVHAQNNDLLAFENDEGVRLFLEGELTEGDDVEDMGVDPVEVDDQEVITSTITIIQDGERQEIEIDSDTQIIIEGDSGDDDTGNGDDNDES